SSSGGTVTSSNVTWNIASFTNAAVSNITLVVTAPNNGTNLTNIVASGAATADSVSTNNNGTASNAQVVTTVTPQADIQTTKTGPTNVLAGNSIVYTITVTN